MWPDFKTIRGYFLLVYAVHFMGTYHAGKSLSCARYLVDTFLRYSETSLLKYTSFVRHGSLSSLLSEICQSMGLVLWVGSSTPLEHFLIACVSQLIAEYYMGKPLYYPARFLSCHALNISRVDPVTTPIYTGGSRGCP